ncbi:hypothetical protein ACIQXV_02830 [Neobacillus sp. NPDC097160]|uniref:hypothetical protein n=1 Tax=Neobacillus sp. NPDC097160 TaxID=3364298 RepID=UPI00381E5922
MGTERLSKLLLLFAGINATAGAAAARLDIIYLFAGLGTGALFYYARKTLLSEKGSTFKAILTKLSDGM